MTDRLGVTFRHTNGQSGEKYFIEPLGSGVALFDYDNDGDVDIYFVNGCNLPGATASEPPTNALYRNDGEQFTDVTDRAGVGDLGYGLGCCVGDYDNDGFDDLYVTNFGANTLYRNNGDGTFTNTTKQAGVGGEELSSGCAFADYDNDGFLDFYVVNYVQFNLDENPKCTHKGVPTYCTPETLQGAPNRLYHNNGDGTFIDVTQIAVRNDALHPAGKGLGVVWGDYDNDGDLDILVANDTTPNFLYRNNGDGTFDDIGLFAGIALSIEGRAYSGMGTNFGDFDNDGYLDIVVTNFQDQTNSLYYNEQNGFFREVSFEKGVGEKSLPYLAWGVDFADFNNDGWLDLFVANGHLDDNIAETHPVGTYAQRNQIFLNNRGMSFSELLDKELSTPKVSRGAAFGDIDNDGDVDIVISNLNDRPTILRNETASENHWLIIKLVGTQGNRNAIGSRVKVIVGEQVQIREVKSGSGYLSQNDMRLHFGLGDVTSVDRVEVKWTNGRVETFEQVKANQILVLTEK
ncbi:CRTAC1 family protein [Candidatus Poribacteria bacterium]|nr:CRTAC1 family protein [Candidatus Poribacteria bacterium]